jgi:hypothetical protein
MRHKHRLTLISLHPLPELGLKGEGCQKDGSGGQAFNESQSEDDVETRQRHQEEEEYGEEDALQ